MTLINTEIDLNRARQLCKDMVRPSFNYEEIDGLELIYNEPYKKVYRWRNLIFKTDQGKVEAKINSKLKNVSCHPKFYGLSKEVVVMDYVEGKHLDEGRYLSDLQSDKIVEAIIELKKMEILCADLHERNIIIDEDGNPMIIDTNGYELMDQWSDEDKDYSVQEEINYVRRSLTMSGIVEKRAKYDPV